MITLSRMFIFIAIPAVVAAILTGLMIPFLKKHQFKQFVREVGPQSHLSKTGTPSMGGIATAATTIVVSIGYGLWLGALNISMVVVLLTGLLFGLIGFIDDYEKAIKKNNKGISPKQKIVMQVAFSLAFGLWAYFHSGDYMILGAFAEAESNSAIWIPLWGQTLDLGIFYIPWVMFVMVAFSNSVNLTDGLDGLASGVTTFVAIFMAVLAMTWGYGDYSLIMIALAGACLGFLVFNRFPAKIFMGDTGSMMLGGMLAATAIMMKAEIILAVAGLVYVFEALSVILQVVYFKKTGGKRLFKMAPLHHHFELSGLHETRVVIMFMAATVVFCGVAYLLMMP